MTPIAYAFLKTLLSYLLMTMREVESENVSLSNTSNLRTVC